MGHLQQTGVIYESTYGLTAGTPGWSNSAASTLNVIRISPKKTEFLNAALTQQGYAIRQVLR